MKKLKMFDDETIEQKDYQQSERWMIGGIQQFLQIN